MKYSKPVLIIRQRVCILKKQVFLAFLFAMLVHPIKGQTWRDLGTDFNTSSNWSTDAVPGSADQATFGASGNRSPNLSAPATINGIYFLSNTSDYSLSSSGSALTLLSTSTSLSTAAIRGSHSSGTNTITAPIIFGATTSSSQLVSQAAGGTLLIPGSLSNTNAIEISISGGGSVAITGNNISLTATTTLGANTTLQVGNDNALGSGVFTFGGGNAQLQSTSSDLRTLSNDVVLATSTSMIGGSGNLELGNLILSGGDRALGINNGLTTVASVAQAGDTARQFTKQGSGDLVVTGAMTNQAHTRIDAGTLAVLGSVQAGIRVHGGVFATNGSFNRSLGAADTAAQFRWSDSGGFAAYGPSSEWGSSSNNLTVNLGGSGDTLTYSSTSNFLTSGSTLVLGSSISNGTVDFQNSLNLAGSVQTVEVHHGAANSNEGSDAVISGTISNGGLIKTGIGTLTLSGANTYSGTTTVTSGTLVINGNQSSATGALTVGDGASLAGTGTIGGATTIQGGGIHGPGNSPGLQTFNDDLSYNPGSIFTWELGSETTAGRGVNFDAVDVGGALTINNAIFRVIISDLSLESPFWDNPSLDWDVFNTSSYGAFTSFELYNANDLISEVDYSDYGNFSFNPSTGNLQWSAVPEPTSALAGMILGTGLLRRRRSKSHLQKQV